MCDIGYRCFVVLAILHVVAIVYEIVEYRKSKRWGFLWWIKYHLCGLSRALVMCDIVMIIGFVLLFIIFGF